MVFYVLLGRDNGFYWYLGSRPTYLECLELHKENAQRWRNCLIIEDEIGSQVPWYERPFNSEEAREARAKADRKALQELAIAAKKKIQDDNIARKLAETSERERLTQKYWPKARSNFQAWEAGLVYHSDYPTRPIGGSNPYYCCKFCERSVPEINGKLEGHLANCPYRIEKTDGTWEYRETYAFNPEKL
jgi:hypothetical protein